MLALDHITVLDLTRRYPGGYGVMFLGDFGAKVIKVDPPSPPDERNSERFAAYFAPDRNKKSIVVDLTKKEGQQVLYRLVKAADVLVEGFRPGVTKRLGADYDTLSKLNPRLIYCSTSGFGQDGPYVHLPAHDMNYIAIAGALSVIGPKDGPPCFPSNYVADMAGCGLHTTIGVLIALIAREKTGKGQYIDISYMDGVLSVMTGDISRYLASGVVPKRGESRSTGGSVWAQVYKTKDGEYYTTAPAERHLWENMCKALEREDLIPYYGATGEEKEKVVRELTPIFASRTRREWFQFFQDKNTCTGPVNYVDEALRDPQVLHRQMVLEVEHPKLGKVKQLGMPIKMSSTPGTIRSLGTPVGAHTDEILTEVGYLRTEIDNLHRQGAVK